MHPGQPRPHVRQGRRHAEPARGSRSHPLSAEARPASAARGEWTRVSWDEALDDIGGRIRKAIVEDRRHEVMYHVGPARRGRLREPRAAGLGRRRPQQPHQRLLLVGAARTFPLDAATIGRRPTTPTRRRSCCCRRTSRPGHYFNPHAQRIIEGQAARRASSSSSIRGCRTRRRRPTCGCPRYPGTEGALLLAIAKYLLDHELYDREFVRDVGELARRTCAASGPTSPLTFDNFIVALKELYAEFTPEYRRRRDRRAGASRSSRPRERSRRPAPRSRRTAGARRRPATCGAGRSRAACTCSSC